MSKQLTIIIGQDLSAYAEINIPEDTDLSDGNLIKIATTALENETFDADWSSVNALRVVSVHDEAGKIIKADIPVEASFYDAGVGLQAFLRGNGNTINTLAEAAVISKLIAPIEAVAYTGHLNYPGGQFAVEFSARKGATQAELDIAFMQGLAQQCTIGYLAVGNKVSL